MIINTDINKDIWTKLLWTGVVTIRAVKSFIKGLGRKKKYKTESWKNSKSTVYKIENSPSRNFSEDILRCMDWEGYLDKFGTLKIVDFGAGDARYYNFFSSILGEGDFTYIAIERPGYQFGEWTNSKKNLVCINADLNGDLPVCIKEANVFISMSVLEHLNSHIEFVNKYISFVSTTSLHIHAVPRYWSIVNYAWHGCGHLNSSDETDLYNSLSDLPIDFKFKSTHGVGFFLILCHLIFITPGQILFKYKLSKSSVKMRFGYIVFSKLFSLMDKMTGTFFASFSVLKIDVDKK